jgi:hypothetical protein
MMRKQLRDKQKRQENETGGEELRLKFRVQRNGEVSDHRREVERGTTSMSGKAVRKWSGRRIIMKGIAGSKESARIEILSVRYERGTTSM